MSIFAPASPKQEMMFKAAMEAQVVIIGGAAGCVPGNTEFLTKEGWVRFDEYKKGMQVAQYDPSSDILSYSSEVDYIKLPCSSMESISGKGMQMTLSDEHTVLYWNEDKVRPKTLPFSEVKYRHNKSAKKGWTGKIKTSFKVSSPGIPISEGDLRLLVAVKADGRIVKEGANNYTQMRFGKERKYNRLIQLCNKFNLPYKDNGRKPHNRYKSGYIWEVIVYPINREKRYDSSFWECSQEQLDIIAEEAPYWDGSHVKKFPSLRYFSNYKEDADFIQYAFSSQGRNTSIVEDTRKDNTSYTVNASLKGGGFRSFANKDRKNELSSVDMEDGYKYCFTTQTGFFIARENGKIFLTGNSGKSYLLQLMPLLLVDDPKTTCIMFRRTTPQITGQGGIWDTAQGIYEQLPAKIRPRIRVQKLEAIFPYVTYKKDGTLIKKDGATVKYQHMERVQDKLNIQGLQYTFIGVDEACQFEWEQLEYMLSRLRSESKYHSRMVMSCNPDPDHEIRKIIDWYLDEDGYPIPERDGVIRYFIRQGGDFIWGNTKEELIEIYGENTLPLSFTFVSANIYDNPPMMKNNPEYVSFLEGLNEVDKAQLLHGCWDARAKGSSYFDRDWLKAVDTVPLGATCVRAYDVAATERSQVEKDPDPTVSIKMYKSKDGYFTLAGEYHKDFYDEPLNCHGRACKRVGDRDNLISRQSEYDGEECMIVLAQDPAAAGKFMFTEMAKRLSSEGYTVKKDPMPVNKQKLTKFLPFAAAAENGLISIVKSTFPLATYDFIMKELERFDGERSAKGKHDDFPDAIASAYNYLVSSRIYKSVPIPTNNISTTLLAQHKSRVK